MTADEMWVDHYAWEAALNPNAVVDEDDNFADSVAAMMAEDEGQDDAADVPDSPELAPPDLPADFEEIDSQGRVVSGE